MFSYGFKLIKTFRKIFVCYAAYWCLVSHMQNYWQKAQLFYLANEVLVRLFRSSEKNTHNPKWYDNCFCYFPQYPLTIIRTTFPKKVSYEAKSLLIIRQANHPRIF